jgi:hypothetical protein
VVDSLSRHPLHSSLDSASCALSESQPKWLEDIVGSYFGDAYAQDLIVKLVVNNDVVPGFSLVNGLLRYKGRLWVRDYVELQNILLLAFHSSAVGGHSRVPITYRKIKQLFAWKGLKTAV